MLAGELGRRKAPGMRMDWQIESRRGAKQGRWIFEEWMTRNTEVGFMSGDFWMKRNAENGEVAEEDAELGEKKRGGRLMSEDF